MVGSEGGVRSAVKIEYRIGERFYEIIEVSNSITYLITQWKYCSRYILDVLGWNITINH